METKIKWNEGEGYITATYEGSGNGSASISSDVNEGIDREQSIKVETTDKSVSSTLLVSQEGLREVFEPSDGAFVLADSGTFNVLKFEKPYIEVEYIESTGAQWIDTGYSINTATDTVEFVFQNVGTTIYKWIMGEHDDRARFGVGSGDGIGKRNVAYGATTYKVADAQIFNSQHIFISNESGVFLDGTKIANFASFASKSSIYLFNLNLNSVNYCGSAKVWSYKHYRNGILIRDFIPVLDKDGVACMYDKISGEFFYNQGRGDFIVGNEI